MPARPILCAALAFAFCAILPPPADAAQRKASVANKPVAQTTAVSTSRADKEKVCIQ
ncbi:MAG: hypothetical protein HXY30_09565 [Pseudorhodoplanes sp.]|nr:hypothetical protein [Pseudorhodoplanes sp.]